MKRFYFAMLCLLAVAATACKDDDESVKVPSAVETSFSTMFPSASLNGWLAWRGYLVADFVLNGSEAQAWYDRSGRWYMTDTEIDYRSLPQAVREAYQQGPYAADWTIEDMEELVRAGMDTIYILEIWQARSQMDLCYTANAILVNIRPYAYGDPTVWVPASVPEAVTLYLDSNYSGYTMIQTVVDGGLTAAIIDYNDRAVSVQFDGTYKWLRSVMRVSQSEVPTVVKEALSGSEYASYIIREIGLTTDSSGEYYTFALTNGVRDVTLKIAASGEIIK